MVQGQGQADKEDARAGLNAAALATACSSCRRAEEAQ